MSTLTVKISGVSQQIIDNSLKIRSRVDDKDSCVFTVRDDTGTLAFTKGQPVSVDDSVLGNLFKGFINKPTCTNLYPNATNLWSMDCVNQFYVAAKKATSTTGTRRHRGGKHKNQHSGAIVANQIQEYLAPEGVSGNFGLDWSELQTDWQMGTQTGVAATTNTSTGNEGAGDLELNPQGTTFTYSGSASVVTNQNLLAMSGYASSGYAIAYTYRQIWSGSQVIASNDQFQYDVWVASTSPQIMSGVEFICSDGTTFTSNATKDQQGLSSATTTDLSGIASDQWYTRTFTLSGSLVGKTLTSVLVFFAGSNAGTYNSYFRNISYFINASIITIPIFLTNSTLMTNVQAHNIGYTNVSLVQTTGGNKVQQISVFPGSFGVVGIVQGSQISWVANLPNGCTALLETSIDAGASWQQATSGSAIPNLLPGMVAGISFNNPYLNYRVTFTLGKDPTAQPSLTAIQITINPSYQATKTDFTKTWQLASDFNTGTFTNLVNNAVAGAGITLNGFQRNWDDAGTANQTLYGATSPTSTVVNKQLVLGTGTGTDVRSRMDFAGQWQNFTATIDVVIPSSANETIGIVYRTTNWNNASATGAWVVDLTTTSLKLGFGTNSGSVGSYTNVATVTLSLAAGSFHRITVVANGTSHQVYLDGVQLINITNSTYNFSGYIGAHAYNNSGSTKTYAFDNFGVCAVLSGTWQSAATSIAGPGTYGGSLVQWDTDNLPDNTTSITVQSSVDGGSTFQAVNNGGTIPNLIAGQSLTGKTLILLVTLTAQNAPVVPDMNAISVWILGQYSSSGSRSTAPLAWDSMNRLNVASGFGTASNGAIYTKIGTGATAVSGNEATISNTTGDVHMRIDGLTQQDTDETVRFSLSASTITAGLELRYSDANDFYRLAASTTTVSIVKVSGGVSITLASVAMTITTATFYRMRFRVVGNGASAPINLYGNVWLDGTTEPAFIITATD